MFKLFDRRFVRPVARYPGHEGGSSEEDHEMSRSTRRRGLSLSAAALVVLYLAAAPSTLAVVGGQEDTANVYASVGQFQVRWDGPDGPWSNQCSGTLIRADVVLTAAHCMVFIEFGFPTSDVRVTFDPAPGPDPTANDPLAVGVDHVAVHPDFLSASRGAGLHAKNSRQSPWEDIALAWLDEPVAGVAPAPVAGPGYLDELDLRSETFVAVGYGLNGFITGSMASPIGSVEYFASRSFAEVTALGDDAYPDRYLKITTANCPGDSGGPLLHRGVVVAIESWTYSLRCTGPGLDYRVDSSIAQDFLQANL